MRRTLEMWLLTVVCARGSRGNYHVSSPNGRWTAARRVRGTSAVDAKAALGGPSLTVRSGQLHLAFARAGKKPGIVYARRRGSRWTRPLRLTKRRDAQPTIAVRANGSRQIVFRRRGLFVLRGGRRWTVIRLPGTAAADTEPWVAASGSGLSLVFARLGGAAPGIYVSRTSAITGRWPARPRRLSSIRTDRNPSLRADGFARETIVFERG